MDTWRRVHTVYTRFSPDTVEFIFKISYCPHDGFISDDLNTFLSTSPITVEVRLKNNRYIFGIRRFPKLTRLQSNNRVGTVEFQHQSATS